MLFVLLSSLTYGLSPAAAAPLLRVGVKADVPPLSVQHSDGTWQGFEVDIATEIAERYGATIAWVPLLNTERLTAVAMGEVDLAIANLGVTPARSRLVDFSPPYYIDGITVLAPVGTTPTTLGVLRGSAAIPAANTYLNPGRLVAFDSYRAGISALEAQTIDGFVGAASVLVGWQQEHPAYALQQPLLSPTALAIALPKGLEHQEWRQFVNQQIQDLRESGWLAERQTFWGLP